MSSFTDLVVKPLDDGTMWEVVSPFVYHVGGPTSDDTVDVPAGFQSDFGSVPRALWWLVSPIGKATKAFVLHDWLYHTGERSRLVSDAILAEAMQVCGVNAFQRYLVWKGVRMGGWLAWRGHRKLEKGETK